MFYQLRRLKPFALAAILVSATSLTQHTEAQSAIGKETKRVQKPFVVLPPRIHTISITMTCRNVPDKDVFAVINDRDDQEIRLEKHGSEWTASLPGTDVATAHASVRLGAARTDCQQAKPDWRRELRGLISRRAVSRSRNSALSLLRPLNSAMYELHWEETSVACHARSRVQPCPEVAMYVPCSFQTRDFSCNWA
jgi:hypothetical protein